MKNSFTLPGWTFVLGALLGAPLLMGQAPPAATVPPATNTPAAPTAQPAIAFAEMAFNFGKVKNTDTLKHDFIVTNTGSAVLEISNVQPGCGCTMAGQWDRQVQPGQTGKIPLQLNPATFNGPVAKSVTVTCNDPARGMTILQLHANVLRPFDVQPQYVTFMPIEGEDAPETKSVRIINNMDQDATLDAPQSSNPRFKVDLKTVRPGKEFEILVTHAGPVSNAPPQGSIVINVGSNTPPITITAMVIPQPALVASPPAIQLPTGPLPPQYQPPAITIRNNAHSPVKLSDPEANAQGVTVQMQETVPGKVFMLNPTFPPNYQAAPGQVIEVAVKTSNPKYPVIKVPVTQAQPPPTPPVTVPAGPPGAK